MTRPHKSQHVLYRGADAEYAAIITDARGTACDLTTMPPGRTGTHLTRVPYVEQPDPTEIGVCFPAEPL